MKRIILLSSALLVVAWGCSKESHSSNKSKNGETDDQETVIDGSSSTDDSSDLISSTSFARTITITYSASGAGKSGDDNNIVTIDGNKVTVNNAGSEVIKYVLTGTSANGYFKIYGAKKQAIVLRNLNLTNPDGAAINNQNKKRTFVVLEGVNRLSDGTNYVACGTEDQKSAFFSEAQLIFSGDGSTVMETLGTSYVSGGSIDITTTGTTYPYTLNGTSDTKSPKGIKIGWAVKKDEHTFSSFSGDFIMTRGKISVRSTNAEAIEVKRELEIQGGEVFAFSQTEDAINSASTFTISGGIVCGISLGNDGMDSNGNFYVKGGVIFASGSGSPELAIDANTEGHFKLYLSGGTIFALGGLESGASLTQACYQASSWTANKYYSVSVGDETFVFKTPSKGGRKLVVSGASMPEIRSNVTVSGGNTIFDGYAVLDGSVSGGTAVSLSNYSSSGGGPGGR